MTMERSSLHIDPALMRNLEVEARRQRRSPSRLAGEAIEVMLRNCAEKRVAIRAAIDEAEAGFVCVRGSDERLGVVVGE